MDTDDLSERTYMAIMMEAERFNHDLTLQFGLLSSECADEIDFIRKSRSLVHQLLKSDEWDIDDLFFGSPPKKEDFHKILNKLLSNIVELQRVQQ